MTFVASVLCDDVFLLDCSVLVLQKEIYVVIFSWGVTNMKTKCLMESTKTLKSPESDVSSTFKKPRMYSSILILSSTMLTHQTNKLICSW